MMGGAMKHWKWPVWCGFAVMMIYYLVAIIFWPKINYDQEYASGKYFWQSVGLIVMGLAIWPVTSSIINLVLIKNNGRVK
jgi:uncharacterized membrane protein YqjE